jgi:periplasmic protein TonB
MAFEAVLTSQRMVPKAWQRAMFTVSVVAHAIALTAGVAHSMWQVDEMPMPAVEVTLTVAPPPPPPPPAPKKQAVKKTKPTPKPTAIVAPKDIPQVKEDPAPEPEEEEEGSDDGVEGGVEGGVAGGTPLPPPVNTGPKLLTMHAGNNLLAINPNVNPYKVRLPEELLERGDEFVAQVRICVTAQGSVSRVDVLKRSERAIDQQLPIVMGKWRYKPYLVDGKPTPFCYPLNYRVR